MRALAALLLCWASIATGQEVSVAEMFERAKAGGSGGATALAQLEFLAATDSAAANAAGVIRYHGLGVPVDQLRGIDHFRQSAALGSLHGRLNLAEMLRDQGQNAAACPEYLKVVNQLSEKQLSGPSDEAATALHQAARCFDEGQLPPPHPAAAKRFREGAALAGNVVALMQAVQELTPPREEADFRRREALLDHLLQMQEPFYQSLVANQLFNAGAVDVPHVSLLATQSASAGDPAGCYYAGVFSLAGFQQRQDSERARLHFKCASREPEILEAAAYFTAIAQADISGLQLDPALSQAIAVAWDAGAVEVWDLAYEFNDVAFLTIHPEAPDCQNLCAVAKAATPAIRAARLEMERLDRVEAEALAQREQQAAQQAIAAEYEANMAAARRERRRAFWSGMLSALAAGVTAYGNAQAGVNTSVYLNPLPAARKVDYQAAYSANVAEFAGPSVSESTYSTFQSNRPAAPRYSFTNYAQPTSPARLSQNSASPITQSVTPRYQPLNAPEGCLFDSQCGFGRICATTRDAQERGKCVAPVDELGLRGNGAAIARCFVQIDCPSGFSCQKGATHENGTCVRD